RLAVAGRRHEQGERRRAGERPQQALALDERARKRDGAADRPQARRAADLAPHTAVASRSAAMRSRRPALSSRATTLIEAATGTARIAPTTPSSALPRMTTAIVVKPDSSTA